MSNESNLSVVLPVLLPLGIIMKVAVPGWDCDEGSRVEVEDGVAVCRCPEGDLP